MIKVCMVVHQYYDRDSRVKRYAESLAHAGAQVDVLSLRDPNQRADIDRQGVQVVTIPIGRAAKSKPGYVLEYFLALVFFTTWLIVLQIKNSYQVIHVHNMPDFLIFTALIPRLLGARLIIDIHDPMPEFYMSKYQAQESAVVRLMRLQERVSSALAHEVITANPNFAHNLAGRGIPAQKITVVNNVADAKIFDRARYPREDDGRHFTLIYPGTIAPRYGLDVAIRAVSLLQEQIPNLRLVIIGMRVNYVDELIALVEQLGVSSFVEIQPLIPVNEVPARMVQADVGIYPALPDPHMNIAMSAKVVEFAFMGIPVVASRLKVLVDTLDDESILFFEPGDEQQFADCVLELFHNPERRQQLVDNMDRTFVSQHSWDNERRTYFTLLNRLLDGSQGKLIVDDGM
jgi:glycosyltransferase involved in cell wall biosynthesis